QKFQSRREIASTMVEHSQDNGDEEGLSFWKATLDAISMLKSDGMSDEDSDHEGQEKVKVVRDLKFRHTDFKALFQHVDSTPRVMKRLFNQSGKKRLRRVFSSEISDRSPPPNLPSTFYRPEYLDLMKKGILPWVVVQENATVSIPKVALPVQEE
ncbi:hypothetical protein K435DRAFT_655203, partial [Dendrothele bispora CBS 962.96]